MGNGIDGWRSTILKVFMKAGWLIIKIVELISKLIGSIFSKK